MLRIEIFLSVGIYHTPYKKYFVKFVITPEKWLK